nr:Morn repeat protein [Pandoravirus massiliensis]
MSNTNTPGVTPVEALLPDEIWLAIFGYLGPRDLANAQRGCRKWSLLACDNALWRPLLAIIATSTPDPAALAMDDLVGITVRDVYVCRVLRSRYAEASDRVPPAAAYASRGVVARHHHKSGVLLRGRFDRRGRLQGYGELDLVRCDNKGRKSMAAYRGLFRDGLYHGRGALTVECRACGRWHQYDCPVYDYVHAACGGALNVLTAEPLNRHTRVSFSGEFAYGLADGFGCATYTKGDNLHAKYKGGWKRGRWHGYGRAHSENGDYCEGDFDQGLPVDNVRARCIEPIPYRFEGRATGGGSDHVQSQTTLDDGTRLVIKRLFAPFGLIHATMHAPDGTVYTNGTWDNGNGYATDPRANGRRYARFHRFTKPCDMAVTDRHGRVWHGCTGGCFGQTHHDPRGVQEIVYPNGDILAVQWTDHTVDVPPFAVPPSRLSSVLSFTVSPNCPDARFAGVTIHGCDWRHSQVGEPRGGRSDEWVFEPQKQYAAQREQFLAYVRSGLGPWSPAALQVYGCGN